MESWHEKPATPVFTLTDDHSSFWTRLSDTVHTRVPKPKQAKRGSVSCEDEGEVPRSWWGSLHPPRLPGRCFHVHVHGVVMLMFMCLSLSAGRRLQG